MAPSVFNASEERASRVTAAVCTDDMVNDSTTYYMRDAWFMSAWLREMFKEIRHKHTATIWASRQTYAAKTFANPRLSIAYLPRPCISSANSCIRPVSLPHRTFVRFCFSRGGI